jgi:3-hydroxymyristoyl/3-hydroxydecanoyl-(acyl carrier protein) dehydratase
MFTEKILSKTDDMFVSEFSIPEDSDYFDGHFPQFKLLPAVAQIELIVKASSKHFMTPLCFCGAKRLKFSGVIEPCATIHLELNYMREKNKLTFTMTDPEGGIKYSSGILLFGK